MRAQRGLRGRVRGRGMDEGGGQRREREGVRGGWAAGEAGEGFIMEESSGGSRSLLSSRSGREKESSGRKMSGEGGRGRIAQEISCE